MTNSYQLAARESMNLFNGGGSKRKNGMRWMMCAVWAKMSGRLKRRHCTKCAPMECEIKIKFGLSFEGLLLEFDENCSLQSSIRPSIQLILCCTYELCKGETTMWKKEQIKVDHNISVESWSILWPTTDLLWPSIVQGIFMLRSFRFLSSTFGLPE